MEATKEPKSVQHIAQAALFLFAFVGFIASLTTIYSSSWQRKSQLSADVYPSSASIPYFIYAGIGSGFEDNERSFVNLLGETCTEANKSKEDKKHFCDHIESLKITSNSVEKLYKFRGVKLDIFLKNNGDVTARNIRVEQSGVEFIDAFSKGSRIKTTYDENGKFYSIPDLNPGEELLIEAWASGTPFRRDSYYHPDVPNITFDGPPVLISNYLYVSESQWSLVEIFFDLGPVAGTFFFIIIGLLAGIFVIIFITVIVGIARGQTLTQIFSTDSNAGTAIS